MSLPARPSQPLYLRLAAKLHLWRPARLVEEAREALAGGQVREARAKLEEAARRAPAWGEPLYQLSLCARLDEEGTGGREEEEALLAAALACDPGHTAAASAELALRAWRAEPLTRAWHFFHGGRYADGLEAFRALLGEVGGRVPESSRADCLAGIGWCHHGMGRADWGAEAFREALALAPDLAHAHKGLGICLYLTGWLDDAEAALRASIALNPAFFDARSFIGWCAYAREDYPRALEAFERAQAGNPLLGDAYWGVGWSVWRLGRVERAAEAFRAAREHEPDHPSASDVAVWVLPDPAYSSLAAEWQGDARADEPGSTPQSPITAERELVLRALEAQVTGRSEEALSILNEGGELPPADGWRAQWVAGRALLALGRQEPALEAFRAALDLVPHRVEPTIDAARTLRATGRSREAERLLRACLRAVPDHPDLVRELDSLLGRPGEVDGEQGRRAREEQQGETAQ